MRGSKKPHSSAFTAWLQLQSQNSPGTHDQSAQSWTAERCVRIPTDTTDARLLHAYNSTYVVSTFLQTRTSDARKLSACLHWLCCSTAIDSPVQSYRTSITSLKLLVNVWLSGLATFCGRPEIAHTPAPLYSMLATVSYTCLRKLLLRRYSKISHFWLVRVQKSVPKNTYITRVLLPYPLLDFCWPGKNQKFQIQLTHAPIHSSVLCSKIHQIRHKIFHKTFVQNSIPFPWVQVYGRQCYIFPGSLFPFMPKCLWNPPNFRAVSN